jgi:hypothetical protein
MELIADNFIRRLHHPEAITCFRRDLAFTIAEGFGRAVKVSSIVISPRIPHMRDHTITIE